MLDVGPEENKSGEVMQNQERTVFTAAVAHVLVDPVCLLVFVFFSSSVFVCLFLTEEIRRNYAKPVVHGYSCGVYWPTVFTVSQRKVHNWF